jgi:dTDP-glucose 4,6-dehydratase
MKYQRYAVLGSNSFAGATFVASALKLGLDVMGCNRSLSSSPIFDQHRQVRSSGTYQFFQADINNDLNQIMRRFDEFCPDVVVDFAGQGMVAESWHAPEQWYTTNIVAKVKLHDQLRQRKWLRRYVRISTPEVYGSQEHLLKEAWQCNPTTPYAVSHAAIDMSLRTFQQQYDFPVVFTRYANFFGPGQQLYRIVPRTIICALLGTKLQLHGGGTSVRAFIYGEDVADAIVRSAEAGVVGEIYHFSPERFLTIRQVVEIICQKMGVDVSAVAEIGGERPGKDQAYLMDASKARSTLGWTESVTFEQGIDKTIEWVKQSLAEIKSLPLNYEHKR